MDNINSTILGFTAENPSNPSLTAIKPDRSIVLFRKEGPEWEILRIRDCSHDSNKIYFCLNGLPLGEFHQLDLEDCESDILTNPKIGQIDRNENILSSLSGGAWIEQSFKNETKFTGKTRLALAFYSKDYDKWTFYLINDIMKNVAKSSTALTSGSVLSLAISIMEADSNFTVCLPIMEPLRIVTPKGVVFFG
jgi:hypothetical protein